MKSIDDRINERWLNLISIIIDLARNHPDKEKLWILEKAKEKVPL